MPPDNVELVRRLCATFHDRAAMDAAFAFYAEDIEWDASIVPDAGVYRGHDGVRAFWRAYLSAWELIDFEYLGWAAEGDDDVVVTLTQRARGRASGIDVTLGPYRQRWTVRDGRVVRMVLELVS